MTMTQHRRPPLVPPAPADADPVARMRYLAAVGISLSPMHPDDYADLRAEYDALAAQVADAPPLPAAPSATSCPGCPVCAPIPPAVGVALSADLARAVAADLATAAAEVEAAVHDPVHDPVTCRACAAGRSVPR